MEKKEYENFKKKWLETFKGYYRKGRVSRIALKKDVFNNPKLNEIQKIDFWKLVIERKYE